MNILIDVDKDKLFKNIVGINSKREFPIEVTIESILDDMVQEIIKYGIPNFRLGFEGDIVLEKSGIILFICYGTMKCSIPVFEKDNGLVMSDQKTSINSRTLSNLFTTLVLSNIKIETSKS